MQIEHHHTNGSAVNHVHNALRTTVAVVKEVNHRPRGILVTGEEVDFRTVRRGVYLARARVLLDEKNQLSGDIGGFTLHVQSTGAGPVRHLWMCVRVVS